MTKASHRRATVVRFCLIAVVATLAAAPSGAQLPPGKWWKDPDLVRDIGLGRSQIEKLEEHFRRLRPRLIDFTAEVQKAEIDLEAGIERLPFDEKRVAPLAERLAEARCRVMQAEMLGMIGARSLLTDEQWALLRARMDRDDFRPPRPPDAPRDAPRGGPRRWDPDPGPDPRPPAER